MIDAARISAIAHGDLPFHNPLSPRRVDDVLGRAGLRRGDRVLDVGCGPGELLIRAAARFGATGTGVDSAAVQIAEAGRRAAERVPVGALRFVAGDASRAAVLPEHGHRLVCCVGSMHAVGGDVGRLAALTAPGGHVLIGDGFWRRDPEPAYLEALGATVDELGDLRGLVARGDGVGLEAVHAAVTTDAEWDRYEWTLIGNALGWAAEHPQDPLAPRVAARARRARERVLGPGGRDTLGFALVLYRRAA